MDESKAQAQAPGGLEEKMRSMILSNASSSNPAPDSSSKQDPSNSPSRGSGRRRSKPKQRSQTVQRIDIFSSPQPPQPLQPPQPTLAARSAHARGGSAGSPRRPGGPSPQFQPTPRQPVSFAGGVHVEPSRIMQRPQSVQALSFGSAASPGLPSPRQTFRPNSNSFNGEDYYAQCQYLDRVAATEIPQVEMTSEEQSLKEAFRLRVENIFQSALKEGYSGDLSNIQLRCFGSLSSGFATRGSDIDLAIVPSWYLPTKPADRVIDRDLPRLLEKKLLDSGFGARLLTRTRVPILKVCEVPLPELYVALCLERNKWDELSEEEKYPPPPNQVQPSTQDKPENKSAVKQIPQAKEANESPRQASNNANEPAEHSKDGSKGTAQVSQASSQISESADGRSNDSNTQQQQQQQQQQRRVEGPWLREKVLGPLDFPKAGVGIQSDINFENPLALHNTDLLRCYSLCDRRVRPMVLFVKAWAKRRKINSSYSGTLSSYGHVLMVLHYLVNIAQPPVCPNLQLCWAPEQESGSVEQALATTLIHGYEVRFWRDEQAIARDAARGLLTANRQPLGALLRGFFQYYATPGYGIRSFNWMAEVLSLRTPGGIRTKQMKGWTGAKSTLMDGREVRHRYLFAIEDPFEWDHNVARTVTHYGIVAIRDEFRRAWRIIAAIGAGRQPEGDLFEAVVEMQPISTPPPTPPASRNVSETVSETVSEVGAADTKIANEAGGW